MDGSKCKRSDESTLVKMICFSLFAFFFLWTLNRNLNKALVPVSRFLFNKTLVPIKQLINFESLNYFHSFNTVSLFPETEKSCSLLWENWPWSLEAQNNTEGKLDEKQKERWRVCEREGNSLSRFSEDPRHWGDSKKYRMDSWITDYRTRSAFPILPAFSFHFPNWKSF